MRFLIWLLFDRGLSSVLDLDFVVQDLDKLLLLQDDVLYKAWLAGRRFHLVQRQLIQRVVDLTCVEGLRRYVILRDL